MNTLADIAKYIPSGRLPVDPLNESGKYEYYYRKGYHKNTAGTGVEVGTPDQYVIVTRLENTTNPEFEALSGYTPKFNYIVGN